MMLAGRLFAVIALIALAACAPGSNVPEDGIPEGAQLTHRAVFIGKNNHLTEGTVSLYQAAEPAVLVFEPNFALPDVTGKPVIALGWNGYRSDAIVATLERMSGRQVYPLPKNLRRYRFNEIWLWNPQRNEPIGLALLTPL